MKYIKMYETKIKNPKIGDYVIIDPHTGSQEVERWVLNHIGEIIDIEKRVDKDLYIIKYENIPNELKGHFSYGNQKNIRKTPKFGIEHFSPDKKNLEIILAANKYNL